MVIKSNFPYNLSLNLLVIASHEGYGSVHVDKLLPSLVKMGCNITFVGWDRKKMLQRKFERNNVAYQMIFRGWGYANKSLMIALPLWILRALLHLITKRRKDDLIMAIDFDTAFPVALSQFITRIPFIYNIRDNFAMRPTLPKVLKPFIALLDQLVINRSVRVIVPDESRIVVKSICNLKKVVVVYNCSIDISKSESIHNDRPFTVYAMGCLLKIRGIHLLLEAARFLLDIRFLIAGRIYEKDLKKQIDDTPNVDYRGWLEQEQALILCHEADLIFAFYDPVSEINRKAASNKWFDAMMASKPVLVNSEVDKSEWILKNDIGYVCPYGDINALVNIIKHIQQNPDEAKRKGENGRRIYEEGYNWPVMEKKIWNMLKEFVVF